MMTKHIRTILCMIILALTMVFASACSFFASETRQISRIYTVRDEEQKGMYIVIEYEGEEAEPDRFFVPDGTSGERGFGIARVDSRQNEQGGTTLYIYYEDASKEADMVEIPAIVGIKDIEFESDPETDDVSIVITLTNDEVITQKLLRGKDGRDGDVIRRFQVRRDGNGDIVYNEDGDMLIEVVVRTYDEESGTYHDVTLEDAFPAPTGKEGRGIEEFKVVGYNELDSELTSDLDSRVTSDPDSYIFIKITYNDGVVEVKYIQRQNQWYTRSGWPAANLGNEGDFYYDTVNHRLFRKGSTGWGQPFAQFDTVEKKSHKVSFFTDGIKIHDYTILHGESFKSTTQGDTDIGTPLPKPDKPGYVFLGWYADDHYVDPDSDEEYDPNAAHFTNLTPVTCDLNLYARWSKKA